MDFVALLAFNKGLGRIENWLLLAANLIIVSGCAGEWWFGGRASDVASELQRRSDIRVAELAKEAAEANLATEQLSAANLALQKQVRGREISEEQRDQVVSGLKGKITSDLRIYVVREPEAQAYAFSISLLLQEVGMKPLVFPMDGVPWVQTGVVFCWKGDKDDQLIRKVLGFDAKIVTLGVPSVSPNPLGPLCPPGSLYVGLKPPLQLIGRIPKPTPTIHP
jgi:hypothetical protein